MILFYISLQTLLNLINLINTHCRVHKLIESLSFTLYYDHYKYLVLSTFEEVKVLSPELN